MPEPPAILTGGLRALCTLLLLLIAACSGSATKPEVGRPAPDFSVTTLDGSTLRLSDLRGKVVFVNLWATWCPPCREEMPSMVRFYEAFKAQGVEIIAVSEDKDPEALRRFVAAQRIPFPVGLDPDKKIYTLYRATGVPETHLLNKKGVIEVSRIGPFDWTAPAVLTTVRELLSQ